MTALPARQFQIRAARETDVSVILSFIRKLAEYEKLLHEVAADENQLRESLFGSRASAEVLLAFVLDEPVGFAVFFRNFSTFSGRPGIYLEDLFVEPEHRGRGIGKALLAYVAKLAVDQRCSRLSWSVLDWNQPAIDFYKSLGAAPLGDWTVFRLKGEALEKLARSAGTL